MFLCFGLALIYLCTSIDAPWEIGPISDDSAGILDSLVTHDVEYGGTPAGALEEILRGTRITGAVVQQFGGCSTDSHLRLTVKKGATVREGLKNLVTADPDYKWNHILPSWMSGCTATTCMRRKTGYHRPAWQTFSDILKSGGVPPNWA
jgi:hypothetical protein